MVWPFYGPCYQLPCWRSCFGFVWPYCGNNNLILSGPVPTRVHAPALGPVPASILGPTAASTCVIPLPAALGSGPAAASLDNINIGPSTTGFGPIAAPVFNIHVLAPGTREPPPRTAVPAPVSVSISTPEVVEESSCLSPGPRFNGPVDPDSDWASLSRPGLA